MLQLCAEASLIHSINCRGGTRLPLTSKYSSNHLLMNFGFTRAFLKSTVSYWFKVLVKQLTDSDPKKMIAATIMFITCLHDNKPKVVLFISRNIHNDIWNDKSFPKLWDRFSDPLHMKFSTKINKWINRNWKYRSYLITGRNIPQGEEIHFIVREFRNNIRIAAMINLL